MSQNTATVIFTDRAFPVWTPWKPPLGLQNGVFDAEQLLPLMLNEIERRKALLIPRSHRTRL